MLKINIYYILIAIIINKTIKFILRFIKNTNQKKLKIIIISKDI